MLKHLYKKGYQKKTLQEHILTKPKNNIKPSANGSTSFPRPQTAWKKKCIHRRNMKLNKNIELNNTTGAIEDAGGTEVSHIVL